MDNQLSRTVGDPTCPMGQLGNGLVRRTFPMVFSIPVLVALVAYGRRTRFVDLASMARNDLIIQLLLLSLPIC